MYAEAVAIEDRLRNALSSDRLSPEEAARAEALLSRLMSPVRVAVLGQRGVGKSSIVNLLAGGPVLPPGVALPTTQISWGAQSETTCTYADRSRRSFADRRLSQVAEDRPVFVALERDLPALRRIALLEVVMDGTPAAQARALAWAAARCDISVWCSREFDAVEQALWAGMPAALRRHGLLALTHLDRRRGGAQARAAHLAHVADEAGNSFHTVLPVDAKAALAAWDAQSGPDRDGLEHSGALALVNAVFDKVAAGYDRVREAAETLLDDAVLSAARAVRHDNRSGRDAAGGDAAGASPSAAGAADAHPARTATPAASGPFASQAAPLTRMHEPASGAPRHPPRAFTPPTAQAPAGATGLHEAQAPYAAAMLAETARPDGAMPPNATARAIEPLADRGGNASEASAPDDSPAPKAATGSTDSDGLASPAGQTATAARLSQGARATVVEAISYLSGRGAAWGKVARTNPGAASRQIMEDVLGDAEWLASYLDPPFRNDEVLMAPCREMATEIVDLVQLMEIERTDTATIDAVCLLLQARRRLQALAASA